MRDQDLIPPLAIEGSTPTLYATLGATIHLEPLVPDDADGLAEAAGVLHEWLAPALRFTRLSCWDEPFRHRPEHLGYIGEYPRSLVFDRSLPDPDERLVSLELQTRPWSDYGVMFHGGETPESASPYKLHFWSEIPRLGTDVPVAVLPVLSVWVPVTTDLAEVRARVLKAASLLRVRWANVGYGYSYYGEDYETCWTSMYAHARRFSGFDVPGYIRNMDVFSMLVRSVSWITLLGGEMAAALEPVALQRATADGLTIDRFGTDGLIIQAGGAPDRGDRNRMAIPPLYSAADRLIRPVRAADAEGFEIVFNGPWDYTTVAQWLRRFEVQTWIS